MKTENGLSLELSEVFQAVEIADVLILQFSHIAKRILFDVRTRRDEGPLIRFVDRVNTPDERFAYLRKLRPGLGDPEKYVFIQWPLGVESLVAGGVWQRIADHCIAAGGLRSSEQCAFLLKKLYELDRREDRESIRGNSFRTLWPPSQE